MQILFDADTDLADTDTKFRTYRISMHVAAGRA